MATNSHLPLIIFFTLTLLVQARLNLNAADHQALITILKDLGVSGELHRPENLCDIAGILCEPRVSNNSYTLRVTGIVFKTHRIRGFLSPAIGQLSELKELSLPNNQLIDRIPPEIAICRKIEVINLSKNKLSGEVPTELSYLLRLQILDLSFNRFSGDLGFLKYFPNLEKLSLESNMFTGKVPVALRSFRNLRLLNVSGNSMLEGPLPELYRLESSSPTLKKPSYKHVPNRYIFVESTSQPEKNGSDSTNSHAPAPSPSPSPSPVEAPNHSHKKNSRKKIMGWLLGLFGGLFSGFISAMIASMLIKLASVMIMNRNNQWGPSIFSQSIKGEDIAFLDDDDAVAALPIAVGVATGLEYLHLSHTPRIVHRDLKPANVLLNDDMEARIADFGLAESIPEADTHRTSSNVAGTLGYIAPEYHQTMKFTDKCDIYSFGVLLGVLVIGKLPSDDFFQHTTEVNLVRWMRKTMTSDNPKEAIDPSLLGNGYEEQMLLVLKIACFCTLDNPKERPNSKDCRCMLAQIEHPTL
ncbi:hypothetical protein E3N88_10174 [Mikania micrantha]|uniref:Protein kinase domain-containing protein n=1 Tax=Mikania micrantha TaxID=192012 RepID=A0A5N6PA25_9ASTR|nr:hypothetical protein E3N88_10174 [Mikania micrantha]